MANVGTVFAGIRTLCATCITSVEPDNCGRESGQDTLRRPTPTLVGLHWDTFPMFPISEAALWLTHLSKKLHHCLVQLSRATRHLSGKQQPLLVPPHGWLPWFSCLIFLGNCSTIDGEIGITLSMSLTHMAFAVCGREDRGKVPAMSDTHKDMFQVMSRIFIRINGRHPFRAWTTRYCGNTGLC